MSGNVRVKSFAVIFDQHIENTIADSDLYVNIFSRCVFVNIVHAFFKNKIEIPPLFHVQLTALGRVFEIDLTGNIAALKNFRNISSHSRLQFLHVIIACIHTPDNIIQCLLRSCTV